MRDDRAATLELIRLFGDTLTRRQLEVLAQMAEHADDDDGELVRECCDGWLGDDRIASRTVDALLRACAIREVSSGFPVERYVINETGREILARRRGARISPAGRTSGDAVLNVPQPVRAG